MATGAIAHQGATKLTEHSSLTFLDLPFEIQKEILFQVPENPQLIATIARADG
jgi:hypothetical protein